MIVELPVTLRKNQIAETVPFRGCVNGSVTVLDGVEYAPVTLRVLGFVGTHIGKQQYQGAYRFEVGEWATKPGYTPGFELHVLPGIAPDTEEHSDVDHPHVEA